ncbi:MAG: hypothetical protein A2X66_05405 [Ignavibacteria bacterium GWA2_54_16]|nr:MAG: hypothetical protein A2X66_05405 [Ignavibacteria bacterium GWA2_54_16]
MASELLLRGKTLDSALIELVGADCNLDCTYCFYLERASEFPDAKVHRMSEGVLEEAVKQILWHGGSHVSFAWQGGEPTLAGLPSFEKANESQIKYGNGKYVGNGLQTDEILLEKDLAKFRGSIRRIDHADEDILHLSKTLSRFRDNPQPWHFL